MLSNFEINDAWIRGTIYSFTCYSMLNKLSMRTKTTLCTLNMKHYMQHSHDVSHPLSLKIRRKWWAPLLHVHHHPNRSSISCLDLSMKINYYHPSWIFHPYLFSTYKLSSLRNIGFFIAPCWSIKVVIVTHSTLLTYCISIFNVCLKIVYLYFSLWAQVDLVNLVP